jgi:2-methylisocitrate lyase-like PEP mutase family enzyme
MRAERKHGLSWRELIESGEQLLLPSAHDGLTARLIEQAGFKAYQIGMFSVVGARFGWPDIDLARLGEK